MVDLAEVNSSVAIDAVTKRQPEQPADAGVSTSTGVSPRPSDLAVNDDVEISTEGQRAADALAGTDALADSLDTIDPVASAAPAAITNDLGDEGLTASFNASVDQSRGSDGAGTLQRGVGASNSAIEDPLSGRNAAVGGSVPLDSTAPATETEQSFPASNQRASVEIDQAGNDDLSQTEAGRTLGQVIDVFA
ncbi:MAG: hypothetical protein OEU46_07170 [Alphaproteobacteria bacterium]|nr:hypothetical protein [Alphaproteobacteria bacterium]